MDDPDYLASLHICVEKTIGTADYFKLGFQKDKQWPKHSTITVSFLSNPPKCGEGTSGSVLLWTPIADMKKLKRSDGSAPMIDPIEYELRNLTPVEAVKKILKERTEPVSGMKFEFVEKNGQVRIDFDPKTGSWSLLGNDAIKQKTGATLSLGWLSASVIIHESMHMACAAIHEHQSPFGKGIQWNIPKVIAWGASTQGWTEEQVRVNILDKYNKDQINGTEYDPDSIMLYFYPAFLTLDNSSTNPNECFSSTDVSWAMKTFEGTGIPAEDYYTPPGKTPPTPSEHPSTPQHPSTTPVSNSFSNSDALKYVSTPFLLISLFSIAWLVYNKFSGGKTGRRKKRR